MSEVSESKVSKSKDPSPQSLSQRESVCGIARFIETAGDVFVAFTQMEDEDIQRVADGLGVEVFACGGHADIEEDVVIAADRVFHDGMLPIQLVQERDEGLSGRALRRGAEVDADHGVHAVVRDDGADQAVLARRQCGHEDDGVVGVMRILTAEEIQPFLFEVGLECICLEIFFEIAFCREWDRIVSHERAFLHHVRRKF